MAYSLPWHIEMEVRPGEWEEVSYMGSGPPFATETEAREFVAERANKEGAFNYKIVGPVCRKIERDPLA